jgi:GAF domain-containing protein/HAMP domain-containing protein
MRRILNILNPISWPIWVKLGALVTVVLLLVFGTGILLLNNLRVVDENALRDYVNQEGGRRRIAVANVLRDAQTRLNQYASDPNVARQLTRLLLADVPSSPALEPLSPELVSAELETALGSSNLYSMIRLVDLQGIIRAGAGRFSPNAVGQSVADEDVFATAQNARLYLNNAQQLIISSQGVPRIEIASVVALPNGEAIGYLFVAVNIRDNLLNILQPEGDQAATQYAPSFSYLVTSSGVIISGARESSLVRAQDSAQTTAVLEALRGQRETGQPLIYRYTSTAITAEGEQIGGQDITNEIEVIGYSSPIPDGEGLTLILESPTNSTLNSTLNQLTSNNGLFVAFIGVPALALILILVLWQIFVRPINTLRDAMVRLGNREFDVAVPAAVRKDEFGALSNSFIDMREQVRKFVAELEERIEARGRDVNTTQDISRFAATQRNAQILMDRVVGLIVERFPNIYHAQIFFTNQDATYAVLRASTNEAGRLLLERGHRLAVGSQSVVGRATEEGRAVIARNTLSSAVHRPNPLLPETRSELAIPMRLGDTVIGVLDVQSKKSDAFTTDEQNLLQTMADQITVALENARLYEESLSRLDEIESNNRITTAQDWQDYLQNERVREMISESGRRNTDMADMRFNAMSQNKTIVSEPSARNTVSLTIPIALRNQPIGAIELEVPLNDFGQDKVLLAEELAARLSVSLENARLFQQSKQATERERMVSNITTQLNSMNDINQILRTAVQEVGRALRAPQVAIRLGEDIGPSTTTLERGANNAVNGNGNSNGQHRNTSANGQHNTQD